MNESIKINDIIIPVEGKVRIELLDDYDKPIKVVEQKNTIADKVYRDIKWTLRNYFNNGCPNNSDEKPPWTWSPFRVITLLSDWFIYHPMEANFEIIDFKDSSEFSAGTNVNSERARRVFTFDKNEANGTIKSVTLGQLTPRTGLFWSHLGFGSACLPYGITYWKETNESGKICKNFILTEPYVAGRTSLTYFKYSGALVPEYLKRVSTMFGPTYYGVAFDGSRAWLVGTGGRIKVGNPDDLTGWWDYGLPIAPNGIQLGTNARGLAYDGSNLWLLETNDTTSWFFKLDTSNVVDIRIIDYFETPRPNLHGLEYYDGHLFTLDDSIFHSQGCSAMLKININSHNIVRTIRLNDCANDIAWDGSNLLSTRYNYYSDGTQYGSIGLEQTFYYEFIDTYLNLEEPIIKTNKYKMRIIYDHIFQD